MGAGRSTITKRKGASAPRLLPVSLPQDPTNNTRPTLPFGERAVQVLPRWLRAVGLQVVVFLGSNYVDKTRLVGVVSCGARAPPSCRKAFSFGSSKKRNDRHAPDSNQRDFGKQPARCTRHRGPPPFQDNGAGRSDASLGGVPARDHRARSQTGCPSAPNRPPGSRFRSTASTRLVASKDASAPAGRHSGRPGHSEAFRPSAASTKCERKGQDRGRLTAFEVGQIQRH